MAGCITRKSNYSIEASNDINSSDFNKDTHTENTCVEYVSDGDNLPYVDNYASQDLDSNTSFSLQDCISEFRGRRKQCLSSPKNRYNFRKYCIGSSKVCFDVGEQDFINQNLCNKEQERKSKHCQDGFCYCFTSDSCESVGGLGEYISSRDTHKRESIRSRQSGRQVSYVTKQNGMIQRPKEICRESIPQVKITEQEQVPFNNPKNSTFSENNLVAISSLETSSNDDPLIYIRQELSKSCVISEIRVNKSKMRASEFNDILNGKSIQTSHGISRKKFETNAKNICIEKGKVVCSSVPVQSIPTAPTLEKILEFNTRSKCNERHRYRGGLLLQKRLSDSLFRYKPENKSKAPPKPQRSFVSYGDRNSESSESTSLSVREAERVVDNFLTIKGCKIMGGTASRNKNSMRRRKMNDYVETKSDPSCIAAGTETKKEAEKINLKHLTQCDIEKDVVWKEFGKNTKSSQPPFLPQSQEICSCNVFNKINIEGKIPLKIDLDTVDGFEHHNLASKTENKKTPSKPKLNISLCKKGEATHTQSFPLSKQLRQLPNWSKIQSSNKGDDSNPNVQSRTKTFIKSSKKKFLRLVSPKKVSKNCINLDIHKTSQRDVGVQTASYFLSSCSHDIPDKYEPNSNFQLPHIKPLSISSRDTKRHDCEFVSSHFGLSSAVNSEKNAPRTSQIRLNLPSDCDIFCDEDYGFVNVLDDKANPEEVKTNHAFNTELDKNTSRSKINNILSNIRAKLEESDKIVARTFLETESGLAIQVNEFDWKDNYLNTQNDALSKMQSHVQLSEIKLSDPIYSEIGDSIYTSKDWNSDNLTSEERLSTAVNSEELYAKVNKNNKPILAANKCSLKQYTPQVYLADVIQNSLKNKRNVVNISPLAPLPEPPGIDNASYASMMSDVKQVPHYQSLNNIRITEQNSTTKKEICFSKSELSLSRSEMFLENFCKSELIVGRRKSIEKLPNVNESCKSSPYKTFIRSENDQEVRYNEYVLYKMSDDYCDANDFIKCTDADYFVATDSNMDLNVIVPPSSHNQITPKQLFLTKDDSNEGNVKVARINDKKILQTNTPHNGSTVRQVHQHYQSYSRRLNDICEYKFINNKNTRSTNTFSIYKGFENVNSTLVERLLLFSALRRENQLAHPTAVKALSVKQHMEIRFFIDDIVLPVNIKAHQDIFFNYFYIITFECCGVVKSTQSRKCENGVAVFRDCDLDFTLRSNLETNAINSAYHLQHNIIRCKIFMLRLRKISTRTIGFKRSISGENLSRSSSFTSISSSSSYNNVVSGFRLFASFTLDANSFMPYEYVPQESKTCEQFYIRASSVCNIPLKLEAKSKNTSQLLQLKGRSVVCFPIYAFKGFLHVADLTLEHDWNRRWCTLKGINLCVWHNESNLDKIPLLTLDLRNIKRDMIYPITSNHRQLRLLSFCLERIIHKNDISGDIFFFATETQESLDDWLKNINIAFNFIDTWLS